MRAVNFAEQQALDASMASGAAAVTVSRLGLVRVEVSVLARSAVTH